MFIDIHAHAYRKPFLQLDGRAPWPTPDQLIEFYDELGVEKAALLPLIGPEFYLPQANEDILEAAERFPGRFIPYCNIHPQAVCNEINAPLSEVFKKYKDAGCRGVGEVICNMSFHDPFMINFFGEVEKAELPLTFHLAHRIRGCYGIYDEPGLPGLDETLSRFPGINFCGHSMAFWAEISLLEKPYDRAGYPIGKVTEGVLPKMLRKHPNLYGDMSAGSGCNAFTRDEEFAVKFINEFQDRLLFGIDICSAPSMKAHGTLAHFLQKLLHEGKITQAVFDKLARTNAERLLKLN